MLIAISKFLREKSWIESKQPNERFDPKSEMNNSELIAELRRSAEGIGFDELPMPGMEEIGMRVRVTLRLAEQINIQSPSPEVTGQVGTKLKSYVTAWKKIQ